MDEVISNRYNIDRIHYGVNYGVIGKKGEKSLYNHITNTDGILYIIL